MKKAILLAALLAAMPALAQNGTAYFLSNHVHSYRLNPAAKPADVCSFGAVGLGGTQVFLGSSDGISDFLFPVEGTLVTGLNETVPAGTFLDGLKNPVNASMTLEKNILNFGLVKESGLMTTFDVSLKGNAYAKCPKDLFVLLKNGGDTEIKDVFMEGRMYVEAALGVALPVGPLRFGAHLKGLAGLSDISLDITRAGLHMNGDIVADASGKLRMAPELIDGTDARELLRPSGWGAALDLGMSYNNERVQFDLSMLDIGFIRWNYVHKGDFGYNGKLKRSAIRDGIETESGKAFSSLDVTLLVGTRIQIIPNLSAGLHGTLGRYTKDIRAGVTYDPWKALSIAATAGMTDFGPCFGTGLNILLKYMTLYLSVDNIVTEFTPQMIPVKPLNTNLNIGLAIVL